MTKEILTIVESIEELHDALATLCNATQSLISKAAFEFVNDKLNNVRTSLTSLVKK